MSLSYSNALIVANGKKPHTVLVLNDNEVIDTVAVYTKKGRTWRPLEFVLYHISEISVWTIKLSKHKIK